jgi:hypothetical protein
VAHLKKRTAPCPFEAVEGSVYIGRERLGKFRQVARRRFETFAATDRRIGVFLTRAAALAKIGNHASLLSYGCSASAPGDDRAV